MRALVCLLFASHLGFSPLVQAGSPNQAQGGFRRSPERDVLHGIESLRVEVSIRNDIPELAEGRLRSDFERIIRARIRIDPESQTVLMVEITAKRLEPPTHPIGYVVYAQARMWQPVHVAKPVDSGEEPGLYLPRAATWLSTPSLDFQPLAGLGQATRKKVQLLADEFLAAHIRANPR